MTVEKKGAEQTIADILEKKNNYGVDIDNLLALLCLVNTMKIVEMMSEDLNEEKTKTSKGKGGGGEGPQVPMGMFARPPSKEQE